MGGKEGVMVALPQENLPCPPGDPLGGTPHRPLKDSPGGSPRNTQEIPARSIPARDPQKVPGGIPLGDPHIEPLPPGGSPERIAQGEPLGNSPGESLEAGDGW